MELNHFPESPLLTRGKYLLILQLAIWVHALRILHHLRYSFSVVVNNLDIQATVFDS